MAMAEVAPSPALVELKDTLREITALRRAAAVLNWDQQTYMPPAGARARAEQLATLQRLAHAQQTAPTLRVLLERAQREVADHDPDSDEACLVRIAQRDYEQAAKLPQDLIVERARNATLANAVWITARRDNDYASFAPWLQKNVELSRRTVECLGYQQHPFDPLIDQREPGMTTASVQALFDGVRPALVSLVQRIGARAEQVDDSVLHRDYDEAAQEQLGRAIVTRFGYDFSRGRLDRTTHPFAITFTPDDVRITTRYSPTFLSMSLMGTMHESGHAMYEQGIAPALENTPLARGVSSGVHESQSRMWENFVGRSLPFWQQCYPTLQSTFPGVLDDVPLATFYRAINKVQPSLIRVEADEVTYSLHIMLRFELEIALLDGSLRVEDAAEAWNAAMERYLGVHPPTNTQGLLQDVHWSSGLGGFQGYALGNMIAAQLWEAILAAHPDLPRQIERAEFGTLLGWLRTNIHQHGRKFDPNVLLERATGSPLTTEPYIRYLEGKFGALYGL